MAITPTIGELRQRVRFETTKAIENELGELTGGWRPLVSGVAARLVPTKGGEDVRAARMAGTVTYDLVVRSTEATRKVTAADRLVDERTGAVFAIRTPPLNLDGRGRFLTFTVEAGGLTQ